MKQRALQFLGLLNRGKLTLIGPSLLNSRKVCLLLLASDCSENSRKALLSLAEKNRCPVLEGASQEELGKALGYDSLSGVGLCQKKAAEALQRKWNSKE